MMLHHQPICVAARPETMLAHPTETKRGSLAPAPLQSAGNQAEHDLVHSRTAVAGEKIQSTAAVSTNASTLSKSSSSRSLQTLLGEEEDLPPASTETARKRETRVDKASKGLRHFSSQVCQKVEAKGITTYNEVWLS